jgi:phage terminase large subunit-like protein
LETAVGAQENPLTVIISTQAPTDADLLSILIDDAQAGHDPRTVLQLHTAPKELDPFDVDTIRLANPALDSFMSAAEVLDMAQAASRMPARENEFRNLVLNQRVEVSNPFISPELWSACAGDVGPLEGLPLYGGLDLAEVADLTALVLMGKVDGKWRVAPTFWLPAEGLAEKSVADRVPYDLWARQGYMQTTSGRSVSYKYVAEYLRQLFLKWDIRKIGFDRWHYQQFLPWLKEAGFGDEFIKEHFIEFGQGFQSMAPALRELEQIIRDRALAHGNHPVLKMCVQNTIIVSDDAGNRKPSKRRSSGRIDGLVALAMAVGVAPQKGPKIDIEALIA